MKQIIHFIITLITLPIWVLYYIILTIAYIIVCAIDWLLSKMFE